MLKNKIVILKSKKFTLFWNHTMLNWFCHKVEPLMDLLTQGLKIHLVKSLSLKVFVYLNQLEYSYWFNPSPDADFSDKIEGWLGL